MRNDEVRKHQRVARPFRLMWESVGPSRSRKLGGSDTPGEPGVPINSNARIKNIVARFAKGAVRDYRRNSFDLEDRASA